jgi:hypothetical protein
MTWQLACVLPLVLLVGGALGLLMWMARTVP